VEGAALARAAEGSAEIGREGRLRRALVVSGSLGQGHASVAEAISAAFDRLGFETRIANAIELLGARGARIGEMVWEGTRDFAGAVANPIFAIA